MYFITPLLAASAVVVATPIGSFFDDYRLIGLSVIGAVIGAMLAVGLAPKTRDTDDAHRQVFANFAVSLGSGVLVSPGLLRFLMDAFPSYFRGQLIPSPETTFTVSGLVALSFIWGLRLVVPKIERYLGKKFEKK